MIEERISKTMVGRSRETEMFKNNLTVFWKAVWD